MSKITINVAAKANTTEAVQKLNELIALQTQLSKGIDIDARVNGDASSSTSSSDSNTDSEIKKTTMSTKLLNVAFSSLSHMAISAVVKSFKSASQEMKKVDTALVQVRKVSDLTETQLNSLSKAAYKVGSELGTSASDYLDAVSDFYRAGFGDQSEGLAKLAEKATLISEMTRDDATSMMIAVSKAYDMNEEGLSRVLDGLNEIDNNYATTIEDISVGLGKVTSIAAQAHVGVNELSAALGTITSVTQRSGTEAATALRALFLNIIGDTKTEIEDGAKWTAGEITGLRDVLRLYASDVVKAAELTGEVINPMEAMSALHQAMEDGRLTEQKLMAMVSDIGGKLRSSQLLALLQNWDEYESQLASFSDSIGSADAEVNKALDSWDVKSQQLANTWTETISKTANTEIIKFILDAANATLSWTDNILNLGVAITSVVLLFKSGLIASIGKFVSGLTKGMALATSFSKSIVGLNGALGAVGVALTIASVAYSAYEHSKKKHQEEIQKSYDDASTAATSAQHYLELSVAYQTANQSSSEFASARKEIIEVLGQEEESVGSLSDAYNNFTIEAITKSIDDANFAVANASKELIKVAKKNLAIGTNDIEEISKKIGIEGFGSSLEKFGSMYSILFGPSKHINTIKDATEYYKEISSLMDEIERKATELGDTSLYDTNMYKRLSQAKSSMEELVNTYETQYKNLIKQNALLDVAETLKSFGGRGAIQTESDFDKLADSIRGCTSDTEQQTAALEILAELLPQYASRIREVTSALDDESSSLNDLTNGIDNASNAYKNYKNSTQDGGEKGDILQNFASMYKSAKKLFDKGLYGSNEYQSAIDALFGTDAVIERYKGDYVEAGEDLGSEFFQALFKYEGKDYGANAAKYLEKNIDDYGGLVDITKDANGNLEVTVLDVEKLAYELEISTEALYALIDAWDIFDSKSASSTDGAIKKIEEARKAIQGLEEVDGKLEVVDGKTIVDAIKMFSYLYSTGKKTKKEIQDTFDTLKGMSDVSLVGLENFNIDDAIAEMKKTMEEDGGIEVTYTATDGGTTETVKKKFADLDAAIKIAGGTATYTSIYRNITENYTRKADGTLVACATGVKNSVGETALVNDEPGGYNPELIVDKGMAYIAGGGYPTVVELSKGATVYTADETRQIFNRSKNGQNAFEAVSHSGVSPISGIHIPKNVSSSSGKSNYGSERSSSGSSTKAEESDWWNQLKEWIDELFEDAEDVMDEYSKKIEAEKDAIQAQIDALEKAREVAEEVNELEEARLSIVEAEKALIDASTERTVRYFNAETGQWEWMADLQSIADAEKELADARKEYEDIVAEQEYNAQIDALNAQIDALEEQEDAVQEWYDSISDLWDDISDEIQDDLDGMNALNLNDILSKFGSSVASANVSDTNSFLEALNKFISDPTGSFDTGGIAVGKGLMHKAIKANEVVLNDSLSSMILSPNSNREFSAFTSSLATLFEMSKLSQAKSTSKLGNSVVNNGGNTYINGVQIGSDMMNKSLSEILSVLPVYSKS